jgi:hypothetical protein
MERQKIRLENRFFNHKNLTIDKHDNDMNLTDSQKKIINLLKKNDFLIKDEAMLENHNFNYISNKQR